ncbi:MAG: hypothetical protein K8S13_00575 [Desulfobacula sp.]|uniref:hypothetical protein n=1 Tax=Desulfobacula sp. TaxID=2593537 RepID=UPI0025B90271|nr:hypothetical protein [Desulfobacula sp.]MCD4718342.1 hypothetical protein [Desulfobacula sp.]
MEYILTYRDRRNYTGSETDLIMKSEPIADSKISIEIKTEAKNVLKLTLSKSEAIAIVKSLSATIDGNCSATIIPNY